MLLPELEDRRVGSARSSRCSRLSAFPEYRSVAHNYVTADELTALLRPGEGYLKLVRLGDELFAVYLSSTRSTGWRVEASAGDIADLVSALRDSISLSIGGVTATYPFDVDSSRALHDALFAPVAADIARLDHLVFEPDGALLQCRSTDNAEGWGEHIKRASRRAATRSTSAASTGSGAQAVSTALSPAASRSRGAPSSAAGRAYSG